MLKVLFHANLRLFDEGGGAAPAPHESGGAAAGGEGLSGESDTESTGVIQGGGFDCGPETSNQQSPDAGGEAQTGGQAAPPQETPEERRAAYEKLREAYKDLLSEDFQKAFNRRFKASKETEAALKAQNDFLGRLHQAHGTASLEELDKVLADSTGLLKPLADRAGMSMTAFAQELRSLWDNAGHMRKQEEQAARDRDDQRIQGILRESMALKNDPLFSGMELGRELADPTFRAKLLSGQSVRSAYLDSHFDGLASHLARRAASGAEKRIVDSIRAKGNRPAENAANPTSGRVYANDVARLTKAQRAVAAKRARKGEKITFR